MIKPAKAESQSPESGNQPPSEPGSGESSAQQTPGATHHDAPTGGQTAPTGVGAVSDILSLTAEAGKSYEGFDAAIHATDKDGNPVRTASGSWARKRGRKKGQDKMSASSPGAPALSIDGTPQETKGIDNKTAAKMYAAMAVGSLIQVFGEEWDVDDKAERDALISATEDYLNATGGANMSPGAGLAFVWGGYAVPRLAKPETKSRLAKFGSWLGGLFKRK